MKGSIVQTNSPDDATRVIGSVLALPAEDRLTVLEAIHTRLADPGIDHGPSEPPSHV